MSIVGCSWTRDYSRVSVSMRGRDEMDEKFLEALCAIKDPTFLRSPRRRPPSTPSAIVRGNLLSNSQAKGDETNAKLISHK